MPGGRPRKPRTLRGGQQSSIVHPPIERALEETSSEQSSDEDIEIDELPHRSSLSTPLRTRTNGSARGRPRSRPRLQQLSYRDQVSHRRITGSHIPDTSGQTSATNSRNTVRRPRFSEGNNSASSTEDRPRTRRRAKSSYARPDQAQLCRTFDGHMAGLHWGTCDNCKEISLYTASVTQVNPCLRCKRYPLRFTTHNNMDPLDVPPELSHLTYIEEQLIAQVHPVLSVYRVKGQQFSYSGNVINFPQDVNEFVQRLPHNPSVLSSVLVVRRGTAERHTDFNVNRQRVMDALLWLRDNNEFYRNITIDASQLQSLPENGNVMDLMQGIASAENDEIEPCNPAAAPSHQDDDQGTDIDTVVQSAVPVVHSPNQAERIKAQLAQASASNPVVWPTTAQSPVNEFTEEGYIARAFPTLFPRGAADLRSLRRDTISPVQYFQHLMKYSDRRFAKHPRFRFFALNTTMRWQAATQGTVFIQRNSLFRNATVDEMKGMLQTNPQLSKQIMFYGNSLRGTRPFWFKRCGELLSMTTQLGIPTCFKTLSAADTYWDDLFALLDLEHRLPTLTGHQAQRYRQQLVNDNPMIVAEFFHIRAEYFVKQTLKAAFSIRDIWARYEWQHRGSAHLHFLVWLDGAPDTSNLDQNTPEELTAIAEYFDGLVSAWNPGVNAPPAIVHPCQKTYSSLSENSLDQDYYECLNRFQRHTRCTVGYCLRKPKAGGSVQCRFKFPFPPSETSSISKVDGRWTYTPKRNDVLLNKHNRFIVQCWRANMDIQPVLSLNDVINYLAKYAAKGEPRSEAYNEVLGKILATPMDSDTPAKKAITKLLISSVAERDYSAQEVCHLLMGLDMYHCSREFAVITIRENDWIVLSEEEEQSRGLSIVDKYRRRRLDQVVDHDGHNKPLSELSLYQMATSFKYYSGNWHKRRSNKNAIVRLFPRLALGTDPSQNEQWYRQHVTLHKAWSDIAPLNIHNATWKEMYDELMTQTAHPLQMEMEDLPQGLNSEDEYDESEPNRVQSEWMLIAQQLPNAGLAGLPLGTRDYDQAYPWDENPERYPGSAFIQSFLSAAKLDVGDTQGVFELPTVTFSAEQSEVFALLDKQIESLVNPSIIVPKRVILQGKAGSGKSTVLKRMTATLFQKLGEKSFRILAPTGAAAINVGGFTIHSALRLFGNLSTVSDLHGETEREFQVDFEAVKFIFIDEYSMIGCRLLQAINRRLQQATGERGVYFGNLFVYLIGDIRQLPPVMDTAVYQPFNQIKGLAAKEGKAVFDSFERCFFLSVSQRQSGDQQNFRDLLDRLSEGVSTVDDHSLLMTRKSSYIPNFETEWRDELRLFPTRELVAEYNRTKLLGLLRPVALIEATCNNDVARRASADTAQGLPQVIHLAVSCRVMLTVNLWTNKGLVNGALGNVVDILYESGNRPPLDQPLAIMVTFDNYTGPNIPGHNVFPVTAITRTFTDRNTACTRSQFPLRLAYAVTIHKSQGLTMNRAVIDIGKSEQNPGLTYVALTRVRTLEGLAFSPLFDYQRLIKLQNAAIAKRMQLEQILKTKTV